MTDRATLPPRRQTNTFKLEWANGAGTKYKFLVSVGLFEDGSPAEAFLESTKMATDTQALARDAAILFSIARQYGTPLQVMQEGVSRNEDGTPQSLLGALLDGIAKEMGVVWSQHPSPHLKVVMPPKSDGEPDEPQPSPAVPPTPPAPSELGNPVFLEHDLSTMPGDACWCGDHPGGACDGCGKIRERKYEHELNVRRDIDQFVEPTTDERMLLSLADMPRIPPSTPLVLGKDPEPTQNVKDWKGTK